jgi:alpha-glucosidase
VGVSRHPSAHPLLRGIRAVLDSYPGDRVMVGEVNLGSPDLLAPYYGAGDELQLVFNFALLWAPWDPAAWAGRIDDSEAALTPRGAWPVWVLSNHDTPRHRTRYGGSEGRARVAATVLLTLRGTPFLYAGEELGLLDADVDAAARVDPGGRDGCRAPIPWDPSPGHGWPAAPWLPWPPDPSSTDATTRAGDAGSILHLYRRLLGARRRSPALRGGAWDRIDGPPEVLAYQRADGDDRRQVWANFADRAVVCDPRPGDWTVDVASAGPATDGRPWDGRLGAEEAVVVRPG